LKTQIGNPEGSDIPNKKLRSKKMDAWKRNDFQRETRASILPTWTTWIYKIKNYEL
jgi:hypothetical protein